MVFGNRFLIILAVFCLPAAVQTALAQSQRIVPIEGRVVYPNGSGADGARVVVASACDTTAHLAQITTTRPDGGFSLKSFDPNCNRYEFSTSHLKDFWLPIGDNVFYLHPNRVKPVIQIVAGKRPPPVLIRLGLQGGEVKLSVFDKRTGSFIYAGLNISR